MSSLCDFSLPLRTNTYGLYRHRRGLGLYRVGLQRKETTHPDVKLAIHAKESPIRIRGKAFYLVSSWPISPAHATQLGHPKDPIIQDTLTRRLTESRPAHTT